MRLNRFVHGPLTRRRIRKFARSGTSDGERLTDRHVRWKERIALLAAVFTIVWVSQDVLPRDGSGSAGLVAIGIAASHAAAVIAVRWDIAPDGGGS